VHWEQRGIRIPPEVSRVFEPNFEGVKKTCAGD
jgi:hypothetical protein